ncbi:ABC transporter ATP-binding protein [Clostridiaceae bacterium]|nr:ABC transporter ATP-binding protein [Clostridiaceae bacterium]
MKLRIENLSFSYEDRPILDRLCLDVKDGEFVSLLGPSGCGKSTVLKLLTGILTPRSGTILVDGQAINGVSERFAYMPQNDLLFPWKTILDNVCLYGQIHGSLREIKSKALAWFPLFGLEGYEHAYPSSLSGGMRQRAAFLRTALCRADILLLDEPFGALDVITRGEMQDWLLRMREQMKKTVLLVTHDMDEAIYLSDRILILNPPPDGLSAGLPVLAAGRNREWLYSQSALRGEIYSQIRRTQTAAAAKGDTSCPL